MLIQSSATWFGAPLFLLGTRNHLLNFIISRAIPLHYLVALHCFELICRSKCFWREFSEVQIFIPAATFQMISAQFLFRYLISLRSSGSVGGGRSLLLLQHLLIYVGASASASVCVCVCHSSVLPQVH